jgi:hypothetical protein
MANADYLNFLKNPKSGMRVVYSKTDFPGKAEKMLVMGVKKRRFNVIGVMKGKKSFIVFELTDLSLQPSEELFIEWVKIWTESSMVPNK